MMQCTIEVESTTDQGSTFTVEMPLTVKSESREACVLITENAPYASSETGKTVLYIEDNPANLKLIHQIFRKNCPDAHFLEAANPYLGLELAVSHLPDIILLDMHLPGLHGVEVMHRLRENPATAAIPVIVISANAQQEEIARARAAGAIDYITKPVDIDLLLNALKNALATADSGNNKTRPAERKIQ